jgi:hypothetical protein
MPSAAAPKLSDQQLSELIALLDGTDTVELKLTIPDTNQRSTVTSLGMDPLDAQIRQIYFFDTPELTLYEQGLVTRARRVQGKGDDSVVKLRPVVPAELSPQLRREELFNVEVDAMPGGFVCSGSMKRAPGKIDVKETLASGAPLRKLFSKKQRALFAEHAPDGIELDELTPLGPIFVLKLKLSPKQFGRKIVAEMWLYPDSTRVLELSTRCGPEEAFDVAARTRALLAKDGVDLEGEQQTKTKKALQVFSKLA